MQNKQSSEQGKSAATEHKAVTAPEMDRLAYVGRYRIAVQPSIFTSRPGKTDIRICEESRWGGRDKNGKLYMTSLVLDAEDYATVRSYQLVPDDIVQAAKNHAESLRASGGIVE